MTSQIRALIFYLRAPSTLEGIFSALAICHYKEWASQNYHQAHIS
jgi:hypothetical protein